MPQPIETAPRDRTILTNLGFSKLVKFRDFSKIGHYFAWVECDPFGGAFDDSDHGMCKISPTHWEPIPDWIIECNR